MSVIGEILIACGSTRTLRVTHPLKIESTIAVRIIFHDLLNGIEESQIL